MRRIWFATSNPGKLAEAKAFLAGWEVLEAPGEVEEDQPDLAGNAIKKARAAAAGGKVFAEDSGLEVDALGGAPGVHSRRYAASDGARVARLLSELAGVPGRQARFRAVIALKEGEELHLFTGSVEGTIATEPRGEGGFGYDPVFIPGEGDGRTFAEMSREEKSALSHRGRALAALAAYLNETAEP